MSKNLFNVLLLIAGGAALWLGGEFFFNLNRYFRLAESAPATVSEWKVLEKKKGKFFIEASYRFQRDEGEIEGTYTFPKPTYDNPYLAQDLIAHWKERPSWTVWFHPRYLSEAALQKHFPMKKGVYFALSLAVILYFVFLKLYFERLHSS